MPVPTHTVACTGKRLIAKDVYEVTFVKPAGFAFKAGQFVLWDVPLVDAPADIQPRAYSIASAPSEHELLFLIKLTPGGRLSRYLVEVLEPGTQMTMKGPFGFFTLKPEHDEEIVLVATGSGLAPFRAHLMELTQAGDKRRCDVIFGVRHAEDLFWTDLLQDFARKFDNVFVHVALTQPTDDWTGHRGRVQTLLPQIVKDVATKRVYACGSPDMTKDVKTMLLGMGMTKDKVHVEGYI
jgi:ferredoxin-NADP reductase